MHPSDAGKQHSRQRWSGLLTVDPTELRHAIRDGWLVDGIDGWLTTPDLDAGTVLFLPKPNLVVNNGITQVQNLAWGIGGTTQVINALGVDNGTSNPTSSSTQAAASGDGATSVRIQAFDSTATQASQVVTCVATFTQAGVAFVMKRLSLSFIASGSLPVTTTGTVPANSLHSMTNVFTMDLTSFTSWSQKFSVTIQGTGS